MGSPKRRAPVTRQHAQALEEIILWCRSQGESIADPLTIDILEEVKGRVEQRAKDAAIFRVRLINHPNPRRPKKVAATRQEARVFQNGIEWSEDENELLRDLTKQAVHWNDMADMGLDGRTGHSCRKQASRLNIQRSGDAMRRQKVIPSVLTIQLDASDPVSAAIANLWSQGKSVEEVADAVNRSAEEVDRRIADMGIAWITPIIPGDPLKLSRRQEAMNRGVLARAREKRELAKQEAIERREAV